MKIGGNAKEIAFFFIYVSTILYLCSRFIDYGMSREKEIYKVTLIGSAGNAALLIFKFIAGIMGHSSAMIADAVHSLSDFVTDFLVLVFVSISLDIFCSHLFSAPI